MKYIVLCALLFSMQANFSQAAGGSMSAGPNPQIDAEGFLNVTRDALKYRQDRRLNEEAFVRMAGEPGTIILDARSAEKFRELHIAGARNLSFPDITAASLAQLTPDKSARILIYCNNNFANSPAAFPSKLPSASLNLSTFVALYNYGFRNVYELGPFIDTNQTKLQLVAAK
ncbi:MAG: rhodanese-like domain-containing protein [Betaproteobacteria bacterium]